MKKQLHPAAIAVIIAAVVGIIGVFYFKEMGGLGQKGPMEVGNSGPFSPGGAAVGKGGGAPTAAKK